jgi:hypothetical protein
VFSFGNFKTALAYITFDLQPSDFYIVLKLSENPTFQVACCHAENILNFGEVKACKFNFRYLSCWELLRVWVLDNLKASSKNHNFESSNFFYHKGEKVVQRTQ